MTLLERVNSKPCGCISGYNSAKNMVAKKTCKSCKGTGELQDNILFHVVGNICVDGDTIK